MKTGRIKPPHNRCCLNDPYELQCILTKISLYEVARSTNSTLITWHNMHNMVSNLVGHTRCKLSAFADTEIGSADSSSKNQLCLALDSILISTRVRVPGVINVSFTTGPFFHYSLTRINRQNSWQTPGYAR